MIRRCLLLIFPLLLTAPAGAQGPPRVANVEPSFVLAGESTSIQGENLAKPTVTEVYLTDGKNDTKLATEEQSAKIIKVKVPPNAPLGRLRVMLLTGGATPQFLEQPVVVTVENAQQREERLAQEKQEAPPEAPPAETPPSAAEPAKPAP